MNTEQQLAILDEVNDKLKDFHAEILACSDIAMKLDALNPTLPGAFTGTPSERIRRQLVALNIIQP